MTPQEMFDKAVIGVVKQGGQSMVRASDICAYRGVGGRKCAVGHLIPDDLYDARMEGKGVGDLPSISPALGDSIRGNLELLRDLQSAHDEAIEGKGYVDDFKARAAEIASYYGLTMPDLESVK